ncbi:UNVERIFIED_CONTAM: hypothetical protein Scaly_2519500 [Sesamum calycinum]|uniref:Uncharacterized protein n=1 Tax=Sesamum calycinum TaxID=2727403 RepID=A0AAW2LT71_9LAMI
MLIKTVVQAILVYVMGCFRIPDSLLAEIVSMTAQFFWHGELERRMHWLAWSKMCRALKGASDHQLKEYNKALLAKQAWRVATKSDTLLHQILRQRHFPSLLLKEDTPHHLHGTQC